MIAAALKIYRNEMIATELRAIEGFDHPTGSSLRCWIGCSATCIWTLFVYINTSKYYKNMRQWWGLRVQWNRRTLATKYQHVRVARGQCRIVWWFEFCWFLSEAGTVWPILAIGRGRNWWRAANSWIWVFLGKPPVFWASENELPCWK